MPSSPAADRGQALTAFVAVVVSALLLVTGLVVDGGRQATATRSASAAAAAAARAATDAGARDRLSGGTGTLVAANAARSHLDAAGLDGTVTTLVDGRVRVQTTRRVQTVFLSLIGIRDLPARGDATSELAAVR